MIPAITKKSVVVAVDIPFSTSQYESVETSVGVALQHLDRNTAKEIGVKEKCKVAYV